jgi:hypothetical protein
MASKGWSKRFDVPIVLEDGNTLRTLRDAIRYLVKTVPAAERDHRDVLFAARSTGGRDWARAVLAVPSKRAHGRVAFEAGSL